jgi:CheY-like chemotaxis protein
MLPSIRLTHDKYKYSCCDVRQAILLDRGAVMFNREWRSSNSSVPRGLSNTGFRFVERVLACGMLTKLQKFKQFGMPDTPRAIGKRVLIAEDDAGTRESLKVLLKIDRHTISEAATGHEALKIFLEEYFDLVILDYFMPGMQGQELAEKIKLIAPTQPILMVTAYYEKLVQSDQPVDAILSKPFGVEELRQAIAKLVA